MAFARTSEIVSNDPSRQAKALQDASLIREGLFDGGLILLNSAGSVTASEPPRLEIMRQDKKSVGGKLTLILLRGIGEAFIARDVDERRIITFLEEDRTRR